MSTDPPARIPQVQPKDLTDDARGVFNALGTIRAGQQAAPSAGGPTAQANHVLRTLAQHPALSKSFLPFNGYLLSANSTLPVRLRQLAIHRVAWIRHCVYMWSSHLRVSLPLGLTREDFDAVKVGEASSHWPPLERTLMRAVDRLVEDSVMSDEVWSALRDELDHQQIMDLVFTVGCYTTLSMMFNTARIEREVELQELAAEYGAPEWPASE